MYNMTNNYLLFSLDILFLLWSMDYRITVSKKQTIFLSVFVVSIMIANFFLHYYVITVFFLIFILLRSKFIETRFSNSIVPVVSFLWVFTLLSAIWIFTFDLPRIFFSPTLFNSNLSFFLLGVLHLMLLSLCSIFTHTLIKKFNVLAIFYSVKKRYRKLSYVILSVYLILFFIHKFYLLTTQTEAFVLSCLIFILGGFLFSLIFYLISSSYTQKEEYTQLSQSLITVQEKYQSITDFRHDYKGILISLNGYLELDDIENAKKYIASITNYSSSVLIPEYYFQLSNISITPLQSVLATFGENMNQKKVPFTLIVEGKIIDIGIQLIDYIRCLTILLNNAEEAVISKKEPTIQVEMTQTESEVILVIKNSDYSNTPLTKIVENGFTSKENHTGKGLSIINKLENEYSNLDFRIERTNNVFVARLVVSL
ncbi:two-component system, LytTR family, sensor histidine kinase AgrC [Enterococcus sp. DIV0840]